MKDGHKQLGRYQNTQSQQKDCKTHPPTLQYVH